MSVDFNIKILVVDDFRTMRRIIINLLSNLGFQDIDEASDGKIALEKIFSKNYDLIISDWNMENFSGLDLLKKVRASEKTNIAEIPFVMITAENKVDNIIEAKKAGVTTYIVKPFNEEILRTKLHSVLGDF